MPGAFVDHCLILPLLIEHLQPKTFQNIFAPPAALIKRYENSIVAIDVTTSKGPARGTGFFAAPSQHSRPLLYTCKHNIDPAEGMTISSISFASGQKINFGTPECHATEDLAIIPYFDFQPAEPVFHFRTEVEAFDEVYTLGFPLVPCAEPMIVAHRGEVNGTAKLYIGGTTVILVSNLNSPGNSGGPLLDRSGFCVGMSIKWLEGDWDGEKARFSAALPAAIIKDFD